MKTKSLLIFFFVSFSVLCFAQEQSNLETAFLKELNNIATDTYKVPKSDFNEQDSIVVIQPYSINKNILSTTYQKKINDTLYSLKMEVPFRKIIKVYIDIYTVLSFNDTVHKTEVTSGKTEVYKTQDWNVGIPLYEGEERTAALQKLLETMYDKAIRKPKATYIKPKKKP
jgi:hypothetical protein